MLLSWHTGRLAQGRLTPFLVVKEVKAAQIVKDTFIELLYISSVP
jgi:hypothetical protein